MEKTRKYDAGMSLPQSSRKKYRLLIKQDVSLAQEYFPLFKRMHFFFKIVQITTASRTKSPA